METEKNYGLLFDEKGLKLHRFHFKQMCKLIGAKVVYRAVRPNKHWTNYSEIESNYFEPILVDCIFNEFPNQQTMKKLGWVTELDANASVISVPYDTPDVQVGALFIIPSGIDNAKGRLFRVQRMSTIMMYPASITCELVPEYENTFSDASYVYTDSSFNLLNTEEENL